MVDDSASASYHSDRSTTTGSTRAARRAGTYVADTAARATTLMTPANVSGSLGVTWNSIAPIAADSGTGLILATESGQGVEIVGERKADDHSRRLHSWFSTQSRKQSRHERFSVHGVRVLASLSV
jgi:hypothetical protein